MFPQVSALGTLGTGHALAAVQAAKVPLRMMRTQDNRGQDETERHENAIVCNLTAEGVPMQGNARVEIRVENTQQLLSRKSHGRSRVGNGAKLLPLTDGRSATARRFKDLVEDIAADLGGKALLSEGQRQLIRRAAIRRV
jgi:hypothetical protein